MSLVAEKNSGAAATASEKVAALVAPLCPALLKSDIHSFLTALKGQCGEQAGKFTGGVIGKGIPRDFPTLVW